MEFLVFFMWALWTPPDFPLPPENYTEWYEYGDYTALETSLHFHEYDCELKTVEDTFQPPYTINLPGLDHYHGRVDSLFGQLRYSAIPGFFTKFAEGKRVVVIRWYPHEEIGVINMLPLHPEPVYFNHIAYKRGKIEKIIIGKREVYRLRGRWWEYQCDGAFQLTGSFTTYFIPTKKLDFRITCLSQFYSYEHTPPPCDAPPEVCDSLIKARYGEEGWKPVHTWPNNIRELEQAVELTFRVK